MLNSAPSPYPHLLRPLQVAHVMLRNRAVMGSMHIGLEEARHGHQRLAAFYAERARGGVGLIVTGGIAPNAVSAVLPGAACTRQPDFAVNHRVVTDAVHAEGGHICMQILHSGRYAHHPEAVAPSAIRSPINRNTPVALAAEAIGQQIDDFVEAARVAREAGYDGVEIMGSEGYFLNQFIALRTNQRDDDWGGELANRIRLPIAVVRAVREAMGQDFIIIYRLSMLDLVEGGSSFDEVVALGRAIEDAGADLINSGIGWHEAQIPTIAAVVPRGAFTWVTARLREQLSIPLITSNRINTPELAEAVLARGDADLISMARPFLADAEFINKAADGNSEDINTCIACNQACLDHIFQGRVASCLVNPRAGHETEISLQPASTVKRLAVVGAGPAGLAFATTAAQRGHAVTLFEAADDIGGQFNLARQVPGKSEFNETLRYFRRRLAAEHVSVKLGHRVTADELQRGPFDEVVIATGVTPRTPQIDGIGHASVLSYVDVLRGAKVGQRVAVIGAGGIGFDICEFLLANGSDETDIAAFMQHWGVDMSLQHRGGLQPDGPPAVVAARQIALLQRKPEKPGKSLGKTTGWIHRTELQRQGVQFFSGCDYQRIDDDGLHLLVNGNAQTLKVDTIVLCAGQESNRTLADAITGLPVHVLGGAARAAELDAKRAIDQGVRLGAVI